MICVEQRQPLVLQMVTDLNLPINAVFVVPACENIPSSTATLPGDVVKSMSGTTIEVLNTDAELILADALPILKDISLN